MEVDGVLVSQFEKKASEAIGLLKMDFLGLITLDIEEETLRLIKQVHGVDVDLDRIPMDDKKVFELLQKGQSAKVFQLESQGMQNLLKKMHPTNFGHINAVISYSVKIQAAYYGNIVRKKPLYLLETPKAHFPSYINKMGIER